MQQGESEIHLFGLSRRLLFNSVLLRSCYNAWYGHYWNIALSQALQKKKKKKKYKHLEDFDHVLDIVGHMVNWCGLESNDNVQG